ncbi:UDP-N-acetylmuramoyl-L-alanyl-D-glutamate--2,6-diaminopimelate ligase [Nocardia sp. CDC186]|uniref:UDP-N-acetylmuramyl-tripeptide synthetase n=1 Tax=Nocardia implantans TaxID=3108168 RepID=A0ABU6AUE6_9NOCA|nr:MULTISPECIES: UDP-N-acetylmuramoyl-L-alanyl-D-glutamate--2,6-diaminopimelate ligase [unclassified Nocardia]MBF6192810.1 UDP-N-acetylmuramoyl-L-alanyl-D-glutamate--2,6-diaminopimelate ligase [Nocardia beijingensis]MEA3530639.1 UDP-N-acetylmuramoyl-L-alanyl-D-glutamate--2,6-diaminopimelate ligase [Nocardia sp. CDC192]MEB3510986.1 UDP-N-acetylmuramoyl-L-alanyl-D-glutamate--2,6-diaminopimelate ligase [Nocardia sp. CDC186]
MSDLALRLGAPGPPDGLAAESTITGISQDSRLVAPGEVYAALPGARHHGAAFAVEAAARGAVAAISDRPCEALPTFLVDDPRRVLGPLASWIYGHPSRELDVFGVTGTNGKTSTAYLLDAGLRGAKIETGLISGVEIRGPWGERPAVRTTPEASELQQTLATFHASGVSAVALEVSSHALALHRVEGIRFRVGVFTNLGADHLDFHNDLENYYSAKAKLFSPERCESAVIGIDDDYGRRLAAETALPHRTFSTQSTAADFYADHIRLDEHNTSFIVHGADRSTAVRLRLLGRHQVDNALGAIAALSTAGVDPEPAIEGMESLECVPGRMQRIEAGQPFLAFVDYMHNTAGQQRQFPYLRSLTSGKIIVVIGATGERDPGKRRPLGWTAATFADTVIVTDESPFSDNPARLREDVAAGAYAAGHAEVILEPRRADAIALAVTLAQAGDVLVVTGRGHDPVQTYGAVTLAFDDRTELRHALERGTANVVPPRR